MGFSSLNRSIYINNIEKNELDVLIIGGGVTGAGIALDAANRGMTVGLIEMNDFASGTSSRSTKLVHGGLRYLKQFEIKIVAEVGKERAIVYENAPHVTTPEKMMLPFYKGGTYNKLSTSFGLKLYDYLAGVKKEERRYMLNKEETLKKEPMLKKEDLIGSGIYVEYKTDDARLTLEVMKKAAEKGATALNYIKALDFIYKGNKVVGVKVKNIVTGKEFNCYAKIIINAAGPWVDELRGKDKSKEGKHLILTKGVHLVFSQERFPLKHAIYFDTPDKRMIFAIPRDGKTYLGTTDTLYENEDLSYPRMTEEDKKYLLKSVNIIFPEIKLSCDDIESNWAGLRVLVHEEGKKMSEISRKDEIFISKSELISIAGGKLTGYRKMAERVVDLVQEKLENKVEKKYIKKPTNYLKLSGGDVGGSKAFDAYVKKKVLTGINIGLSEKETEILVHRYGSNVSNIFELITNVKEQELKGLSKIVYSTLIYGINNEMVVTPLDYFNRRTSALLFDRTWVIKWKIPVVDFMTEYFGWDNQQKDTYILELNRELSFCINAE